MTEHIYLSDFGISKQTVASNLTSTGQFVGTLDYIAPEQIEGRGLDGRADQYSLACAAFELLCGDPPFSGPNIFALINSHLSEQAPSVSKLQPGLPPGVDRVLPRRWTRPRPGAMLMRRVRHRPGSRPRPDAGLARSRWGPHDGARRRGRSQPPVPGHRAGQPWPGACPGWAAAVVGAAVPVGRPAVRSCPAGAAAAVQARCPWRRCAAAVPAASPPGHRGGVACPARGPGDCRRPSRPARNRPAEPGSLADGTAGSQSAI